MSTNTPASEVRDGLLRITIFRNESAEPDAPPRYSGKASRSYQNQDGDWRETTSYSGTEHLRMARLHLKAYDAEMELRAADKAAAN